MMRNRRGGRRWFAAARWTVLGMALMSVATPVAAQDDDELPAGPGRDLVYSTCQTCHDLQYLKESAGIPRSTWDELIDNMRQYGLRMPADRRAKILEYLGTYLGPNPPPKGAAPAAAKTAEPVDGGKLFAENCAACHQENGKGQKGAFPPLAGNPDLMRDRLFPAYVLLNGMEGRISVEGGDYNGQMPSFAHLGDAEIAALIEHIRTAWHNKALRPAALTPVDAAAIKNLRGKSMSPAEVHAYRAGLK